jgi:hypothetical protein
MNAQNAGPVSGTCGGCGAVTEVVDYFGDCICRMCAAEEAEEWPSVAAASDPDPPIVPLFDPPRGRRRRARGGPDGKIVC